MKKFVFASILFIFCLFPIRVNATGLAPSLNAFETLNSGATLLLNAKLTDYGMVGYDLNTIGGVIDLVSDSLNTESQLFEFDPNDIVAVTTLSQSDLNVLESLGTVTLSNGATVSTDNIYMIQLDNGFFSTAIFTDVDGNIISIDGNQTNAVAMKIGGHSYDEYEWENLLDNVAGKIRENNYGVNLTDGQEVTGLSYYFWYGGTRSGRPSYSGSIYVPNQYDPGNIVAFNSGSIVGGWYYNDGYKPIITNVLGTGLNDRYTDATGVFTFGGNTYTHKLTFGLSGSVSGISYQNWVSSGNSQAVFSSIGTTYNSSLNGADSAMYAPLPDTLDEALAIGNAYTLGQLADYMDSAAWDKTFNTDFTGTTIDADNYPFQLTRPQDAVVDTSLPVADTVVVPLNPALDWDTDVDFPDEITLPDTTLPILQNLEKRFPFSIPFDVYNLLKGLSAEPVTPVIEGDIVFPVINYTYHVNLDLSPFDNTAALFRRLFLISFIIGLAWFSFDHFFGS